jgi:mono/diheme cytochrome c family protein
MPHRPALFTAVAALALFSLIHRSDAEPKPASFTNDVLPIFKASCVSCHKQTKRKGRLDLTSYETLMQGGKTPVTVQPGKPAESELFKSISGPSPDMPEEGDPLKPAQVELIRRWIAEGAKKN